LGGGSNVLVNDKGFDGVVIKVQSSKFKVQNSRIIAEAGTNLRELVATSVKRGLTGLEWAVGIPGTLGGAIRGNAGAFGHNISESVKEIKALNKKLQVTSYKFQDCKFSYRQSIFKDNNHIILSAELKLKKGNRKKSQQLMQEYLKKKKATQPLEYPSAGCIFKNLIPKDCPWRRRQGQSLGVISAGYLIEQCGLKGKKIGQAMISEKHANFIVNLGGAQAQDVIQLIKLIKKEVKKKFNIKLEEEIEYLPKFSSRQAQKIW